MFWPPKPKLFVSAASTGSLTARDVRDVVEVAVGPGILEVDRRGHDAVPDRKQADDRLDAAGRGDQVAHHTLGARDRHLVSSIAERSFDRQGLDRIIDRCTGSVSVDVIDVLRFVTPGVGQGLARMQAIAPRPSS